MDKRSFLRTTALGTLAMLSQSVLAQVKTGQKLTLQGTDANGKKVQLSDFVGKTVLLSFYTSGCNLCTRDLTSSASKYSCGVL